MKNKLIKGIEFEDKERCIKMVADIYWFEKGGMNIPQFKVVYDATYNYKINIDD